MDSQDLLRHASRIREALRKAQKEEFPGAVAQASEFLRLYSGPKSAFLKKMEEVSEYSDPGDDYASQVMQSFIDFVEAGLHTDMSPERRAQLDVVSDFLEQAQRLLRTSGFHPAAPTVLIGATLEEFLRGWVEVKELSIGNQKPGLDAYVKALREADLINKQDVKDLTAWAGLRNHAAHGDWGEVSDRTRVAMMLEGVNLFMRKYGA